MIYVDTSPFLIALRYPRDPDAEATRRFLAALAERGDGVTGAYNLLELCGVLSFDLSEAQLTDVVAHFERRFSVRVLPDRAGPASLAPESLPRLLAVVSRRMSARDALVAAAVEALPVAPAAFVTWDAERFRGKLSAPVLTPADPLPGSNAG